MKKGEVEIMPLYKTLFAESENVVFLNNLCFFHH